MNSISNGIALQSLGISSGPLASMESTASRSLNTGTGSNTGSPTGTASGSDSTNSDNAAVGRVSGGSLHGGVVAAALVAGISALMVL